MSVLDTLLSWVAPFLDPMNDFHNHANEMNSVHTNNLQVFQSNLDSLQAKQALQRNTIISGQAGTAINNLGMDFSQTELDISNMAFEVNKLLQITNEFTDSVGEIMEAIEMASVKLEADETLTEITADVDIAAVAEGGFNPIADVLGLILTIIDGALIIDTIKDLAEDIYQDIQGLISDLNYLESVVYPPTAPEPKHNPVPQPDWKQHPHPVNSADLSALQQLYGSKFNADAQQQVTFQAVMKGLLQMGLTKDQIINIMDRLLAAGCSPADILLFLQGLMNSDGSKPNSPTPAQIVKKIDDLNNDDLKELVDQYAQIANIPGAPRLLERLITAPFKNGVYAGYMYELNWCVAHKDDIARIEDITLDSKGRNTQAADVVMKSGLFTQGAIVDTKSYTASTLLDNTEKLKGQIVKDQNDYKGYPIVYVFNSKILNSDGTLPPAVANAFAQLKDAGATIMTSPPDKVWDIANPDMPKAHTTPARLAISAAAAANNAITSGQSQQQLPSGQTNPPEQLPPQQQQELPPMEMH